MIDSAAVGCAHRVPCLSIIEARGHRLRKSAGERIGPCPACGGRDRFGVNIKKNVWNCRGCGKGGDPIALVQHLDRVNFREAVAILTGEAQGVVGRSGARTDLLPKENEVILATADIGVTRKAEDEDEAKRIANAERIWSQSVDPRGTIAERYLESRGLVLDHDLAALRFHSRCPFKLADGTFIHQPAMIGLFTGITDDKLRGIHRTALKADGSGKAEMPDGTSPKKMLGPVKGCAIKFDADETVTTGLHIGEGIETCMAARQLGYRLTWALGSVGAIRQFPVLAGIESLTIITDDDEAGLNAAEECAVRWTDAGLEVLTVRALHGGDANDALRRLKP